MENKKVLIVTYYWPPSGGSGVQRWLKFVKYLHREGWEPYVCTPENPFFTIKDSSLEKDIPESVEVFKLPIWEPYHLFFWLQRLTGNKNIQQTDFVSTGKKSFSQKASSWIRGNLFIPDARIFWVKPTVRFLTDIIQTNDIHRIITTGPPHSIHLIGLRLKRKFPNTTWIADFRDPWSEWDLLDTLSLSSWAKSSHQKLENEVLTAADRVVTIAPYHVARLEALGNRRVDLITNGFDEEDFLPTQSVRNMKFTIRHIGVVDELRDPRPFIEALKIAVTQNPDLEKNVIVEFIGNVNSRFQKLIKDDSGLSQIVSFTPNIPHSNLLAVYSQTDLMLLVLAHTTIASGNLPGKFFEYLASGKPILGIGPSEGDAAEILRQTNAGIILERTDIQQIANAITEYYERWSNGEVTNPSGVNKYTRRALTDQLIKLLN
ncbi:MAG: glycosyltransferase family 4 protein [Cyclobacteriaceae bacterium]